ncbi:MULTISPECIES: polysaccharide deacetylase family protein [Virgibacillus]
MDDIIGNKVSYFRPPYGQYNKDTLKSAELSSNVNITDF